MEERLRKYRRFLYILLLADVCFIVVFLLFRVKQNIPAKIYLYENAQEEFDFSLPLQASVSDGTIDVISNSSEQIENNIVFDFGEPFSLCTKEEGSYDISLKLFGVLPMKNINVRVVEEKEVIPCGDAVGIQVNTNGVLVLGTASVAGVDGNFYEPAKNIIQSGDYIKEINGKKISTKEELIKNLGKIKKDRVLLKILRNDQILQVAIKAIRVENGGYMLGIWVRDDTQGIGTLTYVTKTGEFAALGHGINDVDTGVLMNVEQGFICDAGIYQIVKGKAGKPGEICGYLKKQTNNRIGLIQKNSCYGITGELLDMNRFRRKEYKVGWKQHIKPGKAKILCELGDGINEYDIEIEKIDVSENSGSKCMVLRITDETLLKKTNGIVQGMSGSPIIQDGKVVGAVTHVFVNDPTRGYGIFIENMLDH